MNRQPTFSFKNRSPSVSFCDENCSQCSNEYQENQPWPRRPRGRRQRPPDRPQSRHSSSQIDNRSKSSKSGGLGYIATQMTTTTTKTLVSLKSCRSISEIETLPPTGYFASTVVQSTYINDNFVSDCEDSSDEKETLLHQDACCSTATKER